MPENYAQNFAAAASRFMGRVQVAPSGCWLWTGSRQGAYGQAAIGHRHIGAHRLSYLIHKGEIPAGQMVLHDCPSGDNKLCVNPAHLYAGTKRDNAIDAVRKGQWIPPMRGRTHCKQGHEFTPENTYNYAGLAGKYHAQRRCRTCLRLRARNEANAECEP